MTDLALSDDAAAMVPPAPPHRPLLGVLPEIRRDPLNFLTRTSLDYGYFVKLNVAGSRVFMLSHPDDIEYVLRANHRNYRKSDFYKKLEPVFGKGMVTSDGETWRSQRRAAQPAFHKERIEALSAVMGRTVSDFAGDWASAAARPDEVLDVSKEMMNLSLRVLLDTLFGRGAEAPLDEIVETVSVILAEAERRVWSVADLPLWVPTRRNRMVVDARRRLDEIARSLIRACLRKRDGQGESLVEIMAGQSGDFDEAMLMDQVKTVLTAGHETSASAMTSVWFLLSRHPGSRRLLANELETVLAGRAPTLADLPDLPFTRAIIQEAMRLYPPIWTMSRTPIEDDVIRGFPVPKGSTMMLCPYLVHRNPAFWPNPEGFDPSRFLGADADRRPDYAYFPFGGGARKCIGERFAMMEMMIAVATLAQRFRLDLVPGVPIAPIPMISMRLGPIVPMFVSEIPKWRENRGPDKLAA